jgi:hypothetical protein
MKSSASATAATRPATGRHAGPRHPQDWKGASRPATGRHAEDRTPSDQRAPVADFGAFARRFALSVAC